MSELTDRYRATNPGITATSAALLTLIGCVAFFVQSRVGFPHYPALALSSAWDFEKLVWVTWVALGLSIALLVYECRRDPFIRCLTGILVVLFLIELFPPHLSFGDFPARHRWIVKLISGGAGSIAAAIVIIGLPVFVRRFTLIVREAARSRDNELRLIAAAESSSDAVCIYNSVRDSNGEICDFKFAFLNSNAERVFGMSRDHVLGKNLSEVFLPLRKTDHFEQYKRVVDSGKPTLLEVTSKTFKSGDDTGRYRIQIVKLADGLVATI